MANLPDGSTQALRPGQKYVHSTLPILRTTVPVTLYADNQESIALANHPEFHRRAKHIDVRYHWIPEAILMRQIKITHVPSKEMPADILTKALPAAAFREFCRMIGMRSQAPNACVGVLSIEIRHRIMVESS